MTLARISQLQEQIEPGQYFYISNLVNIRYLTGFSGSNAALLVGVDKVVVATDSRYEIQIENQAPDIQSVIGRNFPDLLLSGLARAEILFEGANLTVNALRSLESNFDHKFVATNGVIECMRIIKDESELALIKTACDISTKSFLEVIDSVKLGQTEKDVRNALEERMRINGADDVAFPSIVAAGPNSAIPHHEPTDRAIQLGDFLKFDFGAKVDGYHADCTRTSVIGKAADWQRDLHAAVTQAQRTGCETIREGIKFNEVENAVNDSLLESGYREFFTHGLGHGVGLEIHEDPFFGRTEDAKIASSTVITIEPGAYLPNKGGVRVEDTIVVNSQGHLNLTDLTYELLEL